MSVNTYSLTIANPLSLHGAWQPHVLEDRDLPLGGYSAEEIEALVASGDCFVTLATKLDKLIQLLTNDAKTVGPEMEQLAQQLFYMQRYYKIVRKLPRYHSER